MNKYKSDLDTPQKVPFVRSPYNYDTRAASKAAALVCEDDSLTIQSAKDECDINNILQNVARGAMLPDNKPQYGDFTNTVTFHDAMNQMSAAREAFWQLPAKLRDRFANDPLRMLDFLEDPENRAEAVKLGLVDSVVNELSPDTPASLKNSSPSVAGGNSGGKHFDNASGD